MRGLENEVVDENVPREDVVVSKANHPAGEGGGGAPARRGRGRPTRAAPVPNDDARPLKRGVAAIASTNSREVGERGISGRRMSTKGDKESLALRGDANERSPTIKRGRRAPPSVLISTGRL